MAGLTDIVVSNFLTITLDTADDGGYATAVGEITGVGFPSDERNIIESTPYGTIYPRKLLGSSTTGNLEITTNLDVTDAGQIALEGLYQSGDAIPVRVTLLAGAGSADGHTLDVTGRCASRTYTTEFDSIATAVYSIAIDGAIGEWTAIP